MSLINIAYTNRFQFLKFFFIFSIVLGSFLFVGKASAATYYIDATNGNNSYTAAQAQDPATPWQTTSKIGGAAIANRDTIKLKAGEVWRGQYIGVNKPNITITSYGTGAKPEVRSSTLITGSWTNEGGNVYSISVASLRNAIICWENETYPLIKASDESHLTSPGMFYPKTATNTLYVRTSNDSDPSTKTIELSSAATVVDLSFATGAVIIDGLKLLHGDNGEWGGIEVYSSSGDLSGTIIRNNEIGPVGGHGVEVYNVTGSVLIEDNYIHNCWNGKAYLSSGAGGGIYFNTATNGIARRNKVTDSYTGISATLASDPLINNNLVINSKVNGIDTSHGITGHSALAYNNTVIHNPANTSGHGIDTQVSGGYFTAKNNLVYSNYTGISSNINLIAIEQSAYSGININNNAYFLAPGATPILGTVGSHSASNLSDWQSALATYTSFTGKDANSIYGDPQFLNFNESDYQLLSISPSIDSGTNVSLTTDYLGNPIYGTPDIGAYEYQPPYTFAANHIPTTGSTRLYSNGKYRMTTASSTTATANFSVTPEEGSYYATTTQYIDITINTWDTTGDKNKEWTATSTAGDFLTHATSTIYTIGDLVPSTYYSFKLDGTASTTAIINNTQCTDGICLSDGDGNLTFTYQGGYSTHTFALEKDVTGPHSFTLSSPANNSSGSTRPTLSWNATSDSESGLAKYQLYIDGALNRDNISSSANSSDPANDLSCGSHTWYIRAIDKAENTTDSNIFNVSYLCGSVSSYQPTHCSSIVYDEWQTTCVNGWQYRNIKSQSPSGCSLTSAQENDRKRQCGTSTAPATETTPTVSTPTSTSDTSVSDSIGNVAWKQILNDAEIITTGDVSQLTAEMGVKRDLSSEVSYRQTIVEKIVKDTVANDQTRNAITNFVTYGTPTTQPLGAGERAGVVNSFKSAFGKLPTTQEDWNDVIKIANGRWPGQISQTAEDRSTVNFKKVYLKTPDRTNPYDDAAITVMAYGLRPVSRNINSEEVAIRTFKAIYGYNPSTATAWDVVRAVAYSGAKR